MLTTTSGGSGEVVDPVEVDVVASDPVVCSVAAVAVSLSACVESDALIDDFDFDDDADDDSEDDESGVSAHATPDPYPVTTAAPTPRATVKPPRRPTHAAAFMDIAIRPRVQRSGGFREKCGEPGQGV